MVPKKAFILAAGFGKRMRPLTETCPKPLLEVGGETLLGRAIDQLAAVGVEEIVINTHHLAEQIEAFVQNVTGPTIHLSHEPDILETGGGLKNALHYFDDEPFFVLAGDGYWIDPPDACELTKLAEVWDPARMDILMSLQPLHTMTLTKGIGDYNLNKSRQATRQKDQSGTHMFNSMRIHHPRIFADVPDGAFSYLDLMDRAEEQTRLYGHVHQGIWHHISTAEDMQAVNTDVAEKKTGT